MPTGALTLNVTDLIDDGVHGRLRVTFERIESATSGIVAAFSFEALGRDRFRMDKIKCRTGPGTLYLARIATPNFRRYGFLQRIREQTQNTPSESPIKLMVRPRRVKSIRAPSYSKLRKAERAFLDAARMQAAKAEDKDLVGLKGADLYDGLGSLRNASLLNIFVKASHLTSDRCFRFCRRLLVVRQDRCACEVDEPIYAFLLNSNRFKSAPKRLHKPLKRYQLVDSFKTKDSHANLQITLMRHATSGTWAADVDIDESSGIEHGFEVIRNALTNKRTNPYLIRELMILSGQGLDPRYRFVFR